MTGGERFTLGQGLSVDPLHNRIVRDGQVVAVEPRIMELLVYLAQRAGEVVSKRELMEDVWRATVVDEAIQRAISLLRTAVGDSAVDPHVIETLPRRGYRLLLTPQPVMGTRAFPRRGLIATAVVMAGVAAAAWIALSGEEVEPTAIPEPLPMADSPPRIDSRAVAPTARTETRADPAGPPTKSPPQTNRQVAVEQQGEPKPSPNSAVPLAPRAPAPSKTPAAETPALEATPTPD